MQIPEEHLVTYRVQKAAVFWGVIKAILALAFASGTIVGLCLVVLSSVRAIPAAAPTEARPPIVPASSARPEPPPLTTTERDSIERRLRALKARFVFARDEVLGGGWYTHTNLTLDYWIEHSIDPHPYIEAPVDAKGNFYLKTTYYGSAGIHHSHIVASVGGTVFESGRAERTDRSSSENVRDAWEAAHFPDGSGNGILRAIARNPGGVARVRFIGLDASDDVTLLDSEKRAIADAIELARLIRQVDTGRRASEVQ